MAGPEDKEKIRRRLIAIAEAELLAEQEAAGASPSPPPPGANARAAYMAQFKLEIEFRDGSRLLRTPEGGQVLVTRTFTETDPKEIERLLKPYRMAEESRAKAAALRKRRLETNARDKELIERGLVSVPKRGTTSDEAAAAQLEAKAIRQEAAFYGLMNASVEQKLGERSEFARNPLAAGVMQLTKGVIGLGQGVDEALGVMMQQPGMTQMGIDAADIVRGAQARTERDYPIASTAAQVAGGVGSALITPGLTVLAAPRGVSVGSQVVSGGVRGSAIGGGEGAVSGALAGTDLESRIQKAGEYGAVGATLGGMLGAFAPAGAAGVQAGGRALGILEDVRPPAAGAAPSPAGAPAAGVTEEAVMNDVIALLRKASTGGMGSDEAVERLAQMAVVDPKVAEAAERLGFQLPPDIFVDHTQLQRAIGLTRSRQGSTAEASFLDAVRNAATRADEVIATLDGSPDLSVVSERVKNSLTTARDGLKTAAQKLFQKTDAIVPPRTRADVTKLRGLLRQRVADLGGDPGRLSAAELKLYRILGSDQPVTMALLKQEKNAIGQALRRQATEYGSLDEATLKRLYGAMSEDQLATVGRVGGQDARDTYRLAIQTEAKARALENRIVKSFGSEVEGSIASKLRTAITSGTKGDIGALNKLLQVIPDNLKKESVASAISAMSRTRGSDGFSFATFETLMKGLRNNTEVYNAVTKAMGPESRQVLEDLFLVSQKVSAAQRAVSMTGKSNQAMLQGLTAEGLVQQAFKAGGKAVVQGTSAAGGAAAGGPVGAAVGAAIGQSLFKGGPEREALEAIAGVLRSEKFQMLLARAAQGESRQPLIREMVVTPEFRRFSALTGLKDPENWLAGTLGASKGAQAELGAQNQRVSDLMANGYSREEAEEIVRLSDESILRKRYNPETGEVE